jgi:hypothetical protein
LIYITVIVAVIYIPSKLGGYGAIFDAAGKALPEKQPKPGALIPGTSDAQWAYATLAFGSAMAIVAVALTAILRAVGAGDSADDTAGDDYEERDVEGAGPLPATPEQEPRFTHEPQPTRQR